MSYFVAIVNELNKEKLRIPKNFIELFKINYTYKPSSISILSEHETFNEIINDFKLPEDFPLYKDGKLVVIDSHGIVVCEWDECCEAEEQNYTQYVDEEQGTMVTLLTTLPRPKIRLVSSCPHRWVNVHSGWSKCSRCNYLAKV
jgi:hypothetical protein